MVAGSWKRGRKTSSAKMVMFEASAMAMICSRASPDKTAPVGLFGVLSRSGQCRLDFQRRQTHFRMMALVFGLIMRRRSSTSGIQSFAGSAAHKSTSTPLYLGTWYSCP